jgi:hypothetical protein
MVGGRTTPDRAALRQHNLTQLVDICLFCQEKGIPYTVMPGLCIPEISPDRFEESIRQYNLFFPLHGIQLIDDPQGQTMSPVKQLHDILSLPKEEIQFRALPFLYLCAMLVVSADPAQSHPWAKFEDFLSLVEEFVGVFSEKELRIAMVVLGDFRAQHLDLFDADGLDLIKSIENNFARRKKKRPKTADDAIRIAFNGSSDLAMLNAAVVRDGKEMDGEVLDIWFGSNDKKLLKFLVELFCYRVIVPGETGMFAEVSYPKGFDVAMLVYEAKLFARKVSMSDNRQIARLDSDLWVIRVKQFLQVLHSAFQVNAAT